LRGHDLFHLPYLTRATPLMQGGMAGIGKALSYVRRTQVTKVAKMGDGAGWARKNLALTLQNRRWMLRHS
jgi:hypothetical protein